MGMRTIAYSIHKETVVPVRYAITVHVQAGDETESLRQHSATTMDTARELVKRIGEYERVPVTCIQEFRALGLPRYQKRNERGGPA